MTLFNEDVRAPYNGKKKKTEARLHVVSFPRWHRVKDLLERITRANEEHPVEFETGSAALRRGKADINELYEDWRRDFERKKPGAEREPRHATYIVLYTKMPTDRGSAYKVNTAVRDFLYKEFGAHGYDYVFAIPLDKQHQEAHVLVKNYNRGLDTKLRLDQQDFLDLRRSFAAELQRQGITKAQYNGTIRRTR